MFRKISSLVVGVLVCGVLVSPAQADETARATAPAAIVESRPDRVSAVQTARAQGSRVEILSEHTASMRTWANPDGTFTSQVFSGPNWVQQSDGSWSELDTTLVASGDGTFSPIQTPMHVVVGDAGATSVALASPTPSDSGAATVSSIGAQQGSIGDPSTLAQVTGLDGIDSGIAANASVTLGWAGNLPTPTVDGSVATFSDVSAGTDVRVGVLPQGVETFVDLKSKPESVSIAGYHVTLPLATKGLTAVETSRGVELRNVQGDVVLNCPDARIWDASVDARSGTSTNEITVATNLVKVDSGYALDVVVPADYFDRATLQYPITVDPTVAPSLSGDTFVEQGYNTTNFGSDPDLRVGTYDAGAHIARSFLNFSFKDVNGNALYKNFFSPNTVVTSASVKLYEYYSSSCTAREIDSHQVTTSWSENSMTWSTRASYHDSIDGAVTDAHGYSSSCPGAWLGAGSGIDVSSTVQAWATSGYAATNPGTAQYVYGVALDAANEADSLSWKRFYSSEYSSSSLRPSLTVTYSHRPNAPSAFTVTGLNRATASSGYFTNQTHPLVSITTSSLDAASYIQGRYVLQTMVGGSATGSTTFDSPGITSQPTQSSSVTTTPYATPTTLANGSSYRYVAYGLGSTDSKSTTPHAVSYNYYNLAGAVTPGYKYSPIFTVDTIQPTQTGLSCTGIVLNNVVPVVPANSTCSLTVSDSLSGAGSTAFVLDNQPGVAVQGTAPTFVINPKLLTTGNHSLTVSSSDVAGNVVTSTSWFALGNATLDQPSEGASFGSAVPVELLGPLGAANGYLQVSVDNGATFQNMTGAIDSISKAPWSGTLYVDGTRRRSHVLLWDPSQQSLTQDAPVILIKGCIVGYSSGTYCETTKIFHQLHMFGNSIPTSNVKIGTVSLFTGELRTTASDASVSLPEGSLSVSRTWLSNPDSQVASDFGPGWVSDLPTLTTDISGTAAASNSEQGLAGAKINDMQTANGTVVLALANGTSLTFMCQACSGSVLNYTATGVAAQAGLQMTRYVQSGSQTASLRVTDQNGVTTTWTQGTTGWVVNTVTDVSGTTRITQRSGTYTSNIVVNGYSLLGRSYTSIAQTSAQNSNGCTISDPTSVPVTGLVAGCAAMTLIRSTQTTATASTPGDIANQISAIIATQWDPTTNTFVNNVVSRYAYDTGGYLVRQWDPLQNLGSGDLITQYGYDSSVGVHKLISVTPASVLATPLTSYTVSYDSAGRVSSVSRANEGTTSFVYNSGMLTSANAPDLSAATIATWDQSVVPTSETQVFAPGQSATDITQSTIVAMDIQGRRTNSATYSNGQWNVDSVGYGPLGQLQWTLTAQNRARALSTVVHAGDPAALPIGDSVSRAQLLRSETLYDPNDPTQMIGSMEPLADIVQADGTTVSAREHTSVMYDKAIPVGVTSPTPATDYGPASLTDGYGVTHEGPWHVVLTSTRSSAVLDPDGVVSDTAGNSYSDIDAVITANNYNATSTSTSGWLFGTPTSTSVHMNSDVNGPAITHTTDVDKWGRVIAVRQPMSTGSDAGTTTTMYYSATNENSIAACNNKPEWAGLVCRTAPAAQPGSGAPLPIVITTYNRDLVASTTTEISSNATTTSTRTTTHSYDAGGRPTVTSIVMTGNGATNGSISASTTYSATTGLPLTVSDGTHTSITDYDQNGRVTAQSDGSGATAQYSYDSFGRLATTTDGISTTTYTYNGTDALGRVDNRGGVTRKSVSSASVAGSGAVSSAVFRAAYDADGSLVGQVYPNGVVVSSVFNPAGQVVELSYVASDGVSVVGDFVRAYNSAGQVAWDSGVSESVSYDYDNAGRLVASMHAVDGSCVAHTYVFDDNSNRLSLRSGSSVSDSCVSASTSGTTVSRAFDSADRVMFSGATGSYVYDNFGRTLTLPKEDTSSAISVATGASIPLSTNVSLMYRADDKVSSMTTGGITRSYQFDQFGRQSSWVDSSAASVVHTNHYVGTSDSPTWSTDSTGAWSRNITDVSGNVALVVTGTTSGTISAPVFVPTGSTVQISDMHGDFVATMATDTGTNTSSSSCAFDDYGATFQSAGLSPSGKYGWLGAKERSTELTGLMLMGVRVYNPATGRFLQVDPVLGGSAGPYLYPTDPILVFDLLGQLWIFSYASKKIAEHLGLAQILGSVAVGALAGLIALAACGPVAPICYVLITVLVKVVLGTVMHIAVDLFASKQPSPKEILQTACEQLVGGALVGGAKATLQAKYGVSGVKLALKELNKLLRRES